MSKSEKDKVLILKSLLKITFIMTCISLILKLAGLNILEADHNNAILLYVSKALSIIEIEIVYAYILLVIQNFIFFRLSCKNKNMVTYYFAAISISFVTMLMQWVTYNSLSLSNSSLMLFYFILTFGLMLIYSIIIDSRIKYNINLQKKKKTFNLVINVWSRIKKPITWLLILSSYQLITMFLRNITYIQVYEYIYGFLLDIDYIILLLTTYYLFLKKNFDIKLQQAFDFYLPKFFDKKPSIEEIKIVITDFQVKIKQFQETEKTEKIVIIIYILLFTLSEIFNLGLVIFIATLNNVLIECLFIVSSFLMTRKVFGAFHFDTAWKCWIVSNLSFFILSKLTINVGITIVVPILSGIGLAYVTSKFIKNKTTEPYRGMSEQELSGLCKNKNLNELETNILMDFYCNRETMVKLTHKYHYSRTQIYEHKLKALKKINV